MKIEIFFKSKTFHWIVAAIGVAIILLAVFQLGMFVGFKKATYSFRWADSYHRTFGGPRGGFLRDFEGRDFISGHGSAGFIAKIDGVNLIVKGQDGAEKILTMTSSTTIMRGRDVIASDKLKVDDRIVSVGSPNADGSIEAKIIRVFDRSQTSASWFSRLRKFKF